ncbi:MAG: LTA synthase family protein [Clostridium sp.]|nr:LTA synthase family protein [Clostridium sp.]
MIFNLLFSLLLLFDFGYYRVNGDFLGLKNILFPNTFNPSSHSIFDFKITDFLVFLDTTVLLIFCFVRHVKNTDKIKIKKFLLSLIISACSFGIALFYFVNIETSAFGNKLLCGQRSALKTIQNIGPLDYEFIQDTKSMINFIKSKSPVPVNKQAEVDRWLKTNTEHLSDNELKGIAKGKNLIFLQVESLENFVINKSTNGQEITPFLNSLTKNSLYFNNIYEQNNGAHSIDCDFLVNTSIYPVGNRVSAIEYGQNIYPNSLPRILTAEGYDTATAHAEKPGDFNWLEFHKNSLGVDKIWSILDFKDDEDIGYGLSDKSILTQFADKIDNLNKPFFAQVYTLTSHGPFNLNKKYRELNLPSDIDSSYLGGYFQSLHYTDEQIKLFFDLLKEKNLLDNTIVVIYGDHTGVHKYYNDSIESLDYEGNWWKDYDRKIPLFIYSSGIEPDVISSPGGQVDLLPTVCYLLGITDASYKNTSMGRNLVNTNIENTILKDTKTDTTLIRGNIKDYSDERHLLDAYPRGADIIKGNYFYRKDIFK